MSGTVVFRSLAEALRAGYQIYDRIETGYLVRIKTSTGWGLAIAETKPA